MGSGVQRVTAEHRRHQLRATPLVVPYFSQNDNASGTGTASCFSSRLAPCSPPTGGKSAGKDAA